jgi:uncharacterized protein (TIGR02001 family)
MQRKLGGALIALAAFVAAGAAHAEDLDLSFSLRGATDYVWRGVSQTDGNPAVFATAEASWRGFYLGLGAENVDFNNSVGAEYDVWAGWAGDVAGFDVNVGLVRYGYVDAPSGADLDTLDAKLAVSREFGDVRVGAAVFHTTDYFGVEDSATYVEVNGRYAFDDKWSVSGAYGQQDISSSDADYANWNLGVSYAVADNVTLDLRYHDTDVDDGPAVFDSRVVASFSVAL